MIGRDGAEDEIRVLLAEAVGALRIISESVGPVGRRNPRQSAQVIADAAARRSLLFTADGDAEASCRGPCGYGGA